MLSMGYVLVMVLSCILFKEPLTVIKIVGPYVFVLVFLIADKRTGKFIRSF